MNTSKWLIYGAIFVAVIAILYFVFKKKTPITSSSNKAKPATPSNPSGTALSWMSGISQVAEKAGLYDLTKSWFGVDGKSDNGTPATTNPSSSITADDLNAAGMDPSLFA